MLEFFQVEFIFAMQKLINIQRLSHTRYKLLPCLNVFLHSTQNNSSGGTNTIEKINCSEKLKEHVVVDLDALKQISWHILNAKHSHIQFQYDSHKKFSIQEFKIDGETRKFPFLPVAEESRQNCKDLKLAILNILSISSGITAETLSEKITFRSVEDNNNNENRQVSLSVLSHNINEEIRESKQLGFEIEKFDLIIDVRSPDEFNKDHIPNSINLPVLNDEERQNVGTVYSSDQTSARGYGAVIISRRISSLIENHLSTLPRDNKILVYCWRGGLRSKSLAVIMNQIGFKNTKLLEGGYKNFRKHVTESLASMVQSHEFLVLAGNTGSGKSLVLECLKEQGENILHLEELANHKGSVLGDNLEGVQPIQKTFETSLWNSLRKLEPGKKIWIEKEGCKIGKIYLPNCLTEVIQNSPKIYLNVDLNNRVNYILKVYQHHTQNPESLLVLLGLLTKHVGKKQITEWQKMINENDFPQLVNSLLTEHYDKTYEFSNKKSEEMKTETNFMFDWPRDLELDREVISSCDILDQIKKLKLN